MCDSHTARSLGQRRERRGRRISLAFALCLINHFFVAYAADERSDERRRTKRQRAETKSSKLMHCLISSPLIVLFILAPVSQVQSARREARADEE